MQTKTLKILKIVAILMLLWTFADNPYSYYQILRWFICGLMGYLFYFSYQDKNTTWSWIFGVITILFNPIIPIYFSRETWFILDVTVAILLFINTIKTK